MAREMLQELQAAEEVKSDVHAKIPYNPLKPGHAKPLKPRGKPYTRPCTNPRNCRRPPGHV
ncbi:hypothetical protein ACLOJK_033002 [Asimina triloba]